MPYWLWIPNPDEVVEEFFGGEGVLLGKGGRDMYVKFFECSGVGEALGMYLGRRLGEEGEIVNYRKGVEPVMSRMRKNEIRGVRLPYPYNYEGDRELFVFYGDKSGNKVRSIKKEEFMSLAKAFKKAFEESYLEYSLFDM